MLAAAERLAQDRVHQRLFLSKGRSSPSPFPNSSFILLVVSRYSAHHWSDFARALSEAHRVLAPGGRAVFMDVVAPERPVLNSFLQTLELLRDPSHVRNYTLSDGSAFDGCWVHARRGDSATFPPRFRELHRAHQYAAPHVAAIRSLQALVADDVKEHLAIEADGSSTIDTASFEAMH